MPLVTLLCGAAGAGKTTYAKSLEAEGAVRISMDEAAWARGYRNEHPPRDVIVELDAELRNALRAAVAADRDVVVDLSLSSRFFRDEYRAVVAETGAECRLVYLETDFDELWRRVAARDEVSSANAFRMTREQLAEYVDGFEVPGDDEHPVVVRT